MRVRRLQPDGTLGPWEYINPKAETPEEKIARLEKEKEELKIYTAALGQTLTEEKITNIQKDMLLQGLGKEVAALKMELITLKGGE